MAKKNLKVVQTLKKTLKKIERNPLLKNKVFSYVILLAAITLALVYISKSNWNALGMYIAIGVLTCFFTKNMTITLGTAMLVSVLINRKELNMEGFEEDKEGFEEDKEGFEEDKEGNENQEKEGNGEVRKCWKKNDAGEYVREGEKDVIQKECEPKPMFCWENDMGDCPKKAGFNNKSIPSSKPARVDGGEDDESEGDRIDHSKTLEQAYDNLQNMLGTDGIKGLTGETAKLIEQQKGLMNSIQGMGPMMKQAEQMMGSLKGMGGMGGMAKMLGGKK